MSFDLQQSTVKASSVHFPRIVSHIDSGLFKIPNRVKSLVDWVRSKPHPVSLVGFGRAHDQRKGEVIPAGNAILSLMGAQ